jgi:hypothetical protein
MPEPTQELSVHAQLTYIVPDRDRHELVKAVELEVTNEGNCWTCYNKKLSLCGFGPSVDDAIEDARQCLTNRWRDAVSLNDDTLTARALAAKRALLELLPFPEEIG